MDADYRQVSDGGDVVRQLLSDFKSLPTKEARQAVLNGIFDELTPDEFRKLSIRSKQKLQRDIVGSLPLELVIEITRYLEPIEIWIFQRVSKRWQTLLTSSEVYNTVFFPLYASPFQDRGNEAISARDIMRCKFGFIHSEVRYAWPADGMKYPDNGLTAEQSVSYSSGRVVWITEDQRIACVKDLMTGTFSEYTTETRGLIRFVQLSQHFLFVQASSYCTAWELSTGHYHQIRLPSPNILEINAHQNRAIIVMKPQARRTEILSWNLENNSVRSTHSCRDLVFTCWARDSNMQADIFIVIQAEEESHSDQDYCRFFSQKFTVSDQEISCLDLKALTVAPDICIDFAEYLTVAHYNQFICRYGTVVSQILPERDEVASTNHFGNDMFIFISYSTETDDLTVQSERLTYGLKQPDLKFSRMLVSGVIYYPKPNGNRIKIHHPPHEKIECASYFKPHGVRKPRRFRKDCLEKIMFTFGDHQLYGVALDSGFVVWSFNSNIQFAPE